MAINGCKMMKKHFWILLTIFSVTLGALSSCKDEKENTYQPTRLFMPTGTVSISYKPDQARLVWQEALYTNPRRTAYEIIISEDTLFSAGAEFSFKTDTTFIVLKKGEIAKDTWYYARVRTVAADGAVEPSNWLPSVNFRISDDNDYHDEGGDL